MSSSRACDLMAKLDKHTHVCVLGDDTSERIFSLSVLATKPTFFNFHQEFSGLESRSPHFPVLKVKMDGSAFRTSSLEKTLYNHSFTHAIHAWKGGMGGGGRGASTASYRKMRDF